MNHLLEQSEMRIATPATPMSNNQIRRQAEPRHSLRPLFGFPIAQVIRYCLFVAALLLATPSRAEIPEPDTIFYGKIINRSSLQEDLLTQGTLSWIIARPDGVQMTLNAVLTPLNNGLYSYSLRVPHEALVYGLTVSSNAIPLTIQSATCSHVQIAVNGMPVSILAPGSSTFVVSQATRSATYRLDLEVFNPLPDTTGDGIPDWWKAKYGIVDPNADPDLDGWSNLQEYLFGGNPTNDNRIPTLLTADMFVYASGTTGVRLQAIDSDSGPTNLFYTLLRLPQTGTLYLRDAVANPAGSDAALAVGSGFTQDDVNNGRLIFAHQSADTSTTADSFTVSLHDETPTHPASTNQVALNIYLPNYADATMQQAQAVPVAPAGFSDISGLSFYEQQMVLNYFLSRDHGYVIWDGSRATAPQQLQVPSSGLSAAQYTQYVASYGHDHPYVLAAGAGSDHLVGGMENDILIAGRGADTLRGNGGGDLFVIPGPNPGAITIEDFTVGAGDALDISRALVGASLSLSNYVQISNSGSNSYLGISFNGDGVSFTNLVIALQGTQLAQSDLRNLVDNGNLITGNKLLYPRISIIASLPAASQNGPVSGQFTLNRSGAADSQLTAYLQITGSAVDGNDYQYLLPQVTFAAGQRTATLTVNPYATSSVFTQVVQVAVISGTGYDVGSPSLAQVTIEPMMPQVSIQAIEPLASKLDQSAGVFLVTRGGMINNSILVHLAIGGTAPAGHYNPISSFLNFNAQQTTALISILPNSTATLSNGLESVQISIKPDTSYRVMSPSTDRVLLVDQILTMGTWQQKYFPGSTEDPAVFALEDSGQTGVQNLLRYAYGLDPYAPQISTRRPAYQLLNDHLSVNFKEPPAVSDVRYVVEVSDDLVNWRSTTNDLEQYFPVAASNDFETVFFRSKSAVSQTQKLFMRIRVQLQP
jgi:cadherin-like protein/hemolysin type calcium-binding protein